MRVLEDLITQNINRDRRVQNIKIPSYGGEEFEQIVLPEYKIYQYNPSETTPKRMLQRRKPTSDQILNPILWIVKAIALAVQTLFSWNLVYSVTGLAAEALKLAISYREEKRGSDVGSDSLFFCGVMRKVRFYKRPVRPYKKLRKIIYAIVDRTTSNSAKANLIRFATLIEYGHIADTALIVLSKVDFSGLPQETLCLENASCDNDFIHRFGREIYQKIRSGDYENAYCLIGNLLREESIQDIGSFEFVMQCLAFCYTKINTYEFIELFGHLIGSGAIMEKSRQIDFTEADSAKRNFSRFCYDLLEHYYKERSLVANVDLQSAKYAIDKINACLKTRDDYFHAALLVEKYGTENEIVSEFILAYFHMEYISETISDEAINKIKRHDCDLAVDFIALLEYPNEKLKNGRDLYNLFYWIKAQNGLSPIVKLCFLYLLVNPCYKNDVVSSDFFLYYKETYLAVTDEAELKHLMIAQFLLFFAVVDRKADYRSCEKFAEIQLNRILKKEVRINDRIYAKICRSLNGLRVDCFRDNLEDMLKATLVWEKYPQEELYFHMNLGVLYAYNEKFEAALRTYRKIDLRRLKNDDELYMTYLNNACVFRYLKYQTLKSAQKEYRKLQKCLLYCRTNEIRTEETRHLSVNALIMGILAGQPIEEVRRLSQEAYDLAGEDEYYMMYLNQAQWLLSYVYRETPNYTEIETDSVFFRTKKSFFHAKKLVFEDAHDSVLSVKELNCALRHQLDRFGTDFNYFKRADLFTMIERWYE